MFPYAIENPAPDRRGLISALIAVNVLMLVAQILYPSLLDLAFVPAERAPLTWITSQFLHADLGHIFGNMYALYLFGPEIAYRLGRWFFPFYLAGGMAANLLHAVSGPFSRVPCVGASGAVAACIGAYVVLFPRARLKFFGTSLLQRSTLTYTLSTALFAILWLLLEGMGLVGGYDGVAHWTHLGGFLFGAAAATAMPAENEAETDRERDAEQARAISEALGAGDDAAAAARFAEVAASRPSFEMPTAAAQLEAGKALFRVGRAHLAEAALRRITDRFPQDHACAHALLLLGDLELMRFKEFAAALARYRAAAAHPAADAEVRRNAEDGAAHARTALSADAPAGASRPCAVLFEAEPPMTPEQLETVRRLMETSPGPMSGYLVRGLDAAAAIAAARRLEEGGVPAVVMPEASLLRLATGSAVEALTFEADGVHAGGVLQMEYREILLAAVVWVVELASKDDPGMFEVGVDSISIRGNYASSPLKPKRAVRRHSPRIELVARDGRRLRMDPTDEGLEHLRAAADQVSLRAPDAHLDWGARAALSGHAPAWARFDDARAADAYLDWQVQLAALKSLASYGRSLRKPAP